jgi:hypothetical protein
VLVSLLVLLETRYLISQRALSFKAASDGNLRTQN